jgi:hypothetical protein
MEFFLCAPKENVRPARFRKPEPEDLEADLKVASCSGFLEMLRGSSLPACPMSAEEGAVDALLCREEASVDAPLVELEAPLPLV